MKTYMNAFLGIMIGIGLFISLELTAPHWSYLLQIGSVYFVGFGVFIVRLFLFLESMYNESFGEYCHGYAWPLSVSVQSYPNTFVYGTFIFVGFIGTAIVTSDVHYLITIFCMCILCMHTISYFNVLKS
jgi:hypothetical protein